MINLFLLLLLILVTFLSLMFGGENTIDFSLTNTILMQIRLPRTIIATLAGGGLAVSGLTFQNTFRNNLASPYTLGVGSGASFGVCLAYFFQWHNLFEQVYLGNVFFAFAGSLLSILSIWFISKYTGGFSSHQIILAGIIVGFFFSSMILLIQFLSLEVNASRMLQWVMGDLNVIGLDSISFIIFPIILTLYALYRFRNEQNLMLLGDTFARVRGIDVEKIRKSSFIYCSLLIALIVSIVGPIAFVGLIVPHFIKKIVGVHYSVNFIPTFLSGGVFLLLCDLISRKVLLQQNLPIGVITALIGGPVFLITLIKK